MMNILRYIFYPNPVAPNYADTKVIVALVLMAALFVAAFVLRRMLKTSRDTQFKKLASSWPTACFWFAFFGVMMIVARTESISYISMRLWWFVWGIIALLYLFTQIRVYQARYYKVIGTTAVHAKKALPYLPKKKK